VAAKQFPDIQQSGRMPLAREQPMWTAIGEGSLLLGVTGWPSTPIADAGFLRGVFAALLFATATCGAGVVFALIAVPSPPVGMTISFLP
jgi:hypothetical protein